MASNYNSGDDALVYIRRAAGDDATAQYDYYLMTSLPTNDNPRYSVGNNNGKQDIITSFHNKFRLGPSDIKIQTSPYPQVSGDKYDSTAIFSPDIAVEVKIYVNDEPVTYYAGFHTDTGNIVNDYIPYRNKKLGYNDQAAYPYYANDFIQYTGVPEFKFKQMYYNKFKIPTNSGEFNALPELASGIVSGVPSIIDQTGVYGVASKHYPDEYKTKEYKLTYNTTYDFIDMESQELIVSGNFNYPNTIPLDPEPNPSKTFNPYPNHVVFVTGIITENTDGPIESFGNAEKKRREAGSQLYKMPLLNFYQRDDMTNCKVTQIAYKISNADPYTHKKAWWTGSPSAPDRRIWVSPTSSTPSMYVFYSADNGAGYSRLPECWPWSCRRWTVDKTSGELKTTIIGGIQYSYRDTIITYNTQDASGNRIPTSIGEVPKFTIKLSSFTGNEKTYTPYILNDDPFSTIDYSPVENKLGKGYTPVDPVPGSYFNGYFSGVLDLAQDIDDAQAEQCGCNASDVKIQLAAELFPVMHNATCKYVLKLGYLCYPTLDCKVPNVGTAFKKIIYPFNSCRFNETFEIDLDKLKYPDIDIDNKKLVIKPLNKGLLSYVFISGIKPIVTDPYTYEKPKPITGTTGIGNGSTGATGFIIYPPYTEQKTVALDGGYTIDMTNKVGFLSIAARYPCKYTTDVNIYQVTQDGLEVKFIYPLNTIHDCPIQSLAKLTIQGNATDEKSESPDDVITGGDYYFKDGKRTFWNKCDLPKQDEIYQTSSLGNIQNFITTQNGCCNKCKFGPIGAVTYRPLAQCIDLEKEATSVGVGWLDEGLTDDKCAMKKKTPCQKTQVRGNAILVSTSTVYAQTAEDIWMNGSGEMVADDNFIKMFDTGTLLESESIVSGVYPTIRVNAVVDTLENTSDIIASAIIITE